MIRAGVYWIDTGWYPVLVGLSIGEGHWHKTVRAFGLGDKDWPVRHTQGGITTRFKSVDTSDEMILVALGTQLTDPVQVVCTLVHEVVHVWQFICEVIGEQEPAREQEAYAIQNLTEQFLVAYSKTIGKGKTWEFGDERGAVVEGAPEARGDSAVAVLAGRRDPGRATSVLRGRRSCAKHRGPAGPLP